MNAYATAAWKLFSQVCKKSLLQQPKQVRLELNAGLVSLKTFQRDAREGEHVWCSPGRGT